MEMFFGQLLGKDLRQFFGGIKFLCESCEVRPSCVDSFSKSLFGLNDFQFVHLPKILIYAVITIKTNRTIQRIRSPASTSLSLFCLSVQMAFLRMATVSVA